MVVHNLVEQEVIQNLAKWVVIHNLVELAVTRLVAVHILAISEVDHNLVKLEVIQNLIRSLEVNSCFVVTVDYKFIDQMVKHVLKVALLILAVRNLVRHAIHQIEDTQDYVESLLMDLN